MKATQLDRKAFSQFHLAMRVLCKEQPGSWQPLVSVLRVSKSGELGLTSARIDRLVALQYVETRRGDGSGAEVRIAPVSIFATVSQ